MKQTTTKTNKKQKENENEKNPNKQKTINKQTYNVIDIRIVSTAALKIIWMVLIVVTSSLYIAQNWFCLTGSAEGNEETNRRNVDNMQILGSETASSYINHRYGKVIIIMNIFFPEIRHDFGRWGWRPG